jgi:hypothetical protein
MKHLTEENHSTRKTKEGKKKCNTNIVLEIIEMQGMKPVPNC